MPIYITPQQYFLRLHHIRPRFKDDVENVLFYMANEIYKIGKKDSDLFKTQLNSSIRLFPGNFRKEEKTINNWRTEISALFGLIQYEDGQSKPSAITNNLVTNSNLIEFFRYFLYNFQYPGGHLKPNESLLLIQNKVKFKPASFILQAYLEGRRITEKDFGISQAEATHCIFNDLRVTTGQRRPAEVVELIIFNRKNNIDYDTGGDTVRYAGDILDYMELADLVTLKQNNKYYLNNYQADVITSIINNDQYFQPFERLYGLTNLSLSDISAATGAWYDFINSNIDDSIFNSDIASILEGFQAEEVESTSPEDAKFINEIISKLRDDSKKPKNTKEIGDIGEAIAIEHEKNRLTSISPSYSAMLHWIKKIPESLAMGYDINSLEGVADKRRCIEVKTTLSMGKINATSFHMTPSEWSAASSLGQSYFVYRLTISKKEISLFVIKDPVQMYKENRLDMTIGDGVDISYNKQTSGTYVELCR